MLWLYGLAAIVVSSALLYVAGEFLIGSLLRLSRYFKVTEFLVAFFVMAAASSLPNLFVGVTSALQGIPELSFGDIMGNNIMALTVAVALCIFFAPKRLLPVRTDLVRDTAFITSAAAVLPLILVADGALSRSDGLILVLFFLTYAYWLTWRRRRFSRVFEEEREALPRADILIDVIKVVVGVALLALAAQGVVYGAELLGAALGLPLVLIGVLVTGIGNSLPEIYFAVASARRGATGLIIGGLLGAVIVPATLVLGIVALIEPIQNEALALSLVNRICLAGAAFFFLYISQTRRAIGWREAAVLVGIFGLFLLSLLAV